MADFMVKWQGNVEDTTKEIFLHLLDRPLRAGMPKTIAMVGDSRAGKSVLGLKIQDIIYESHHIDFLEILEHCVLIRPQEYQTKVTAILKGSTPETRKVKTVQLDEGKFLINSADWQSVRNKTMRTIAATSAAIKPLIFIIVSQLYSDIDAKTRQSINYLFDVKRSPGGKPRVTPYVLYEDIKDVSKAKMKRRRLTGLIEYSDGKVVQFRPVFRPELPRKELLDKYHSFELPNKEEEIFKILEDMEKQVSKLSGKTDTKVRELAEYLVNNPDKLQEAGALNRKGDWKFKRDALGRYNFTSREFKQIEELVRNNMFEKRQREMVKHDAESVVLSEVN